MTRKTCSRFNQYIKYEGTLASANEIVAFATEYGSWLGQNYHGELISWSSSVMHLYVKSNDNNDILGDGTINVNEYAVGLSDGGPTFGITQASFDNQFRDVGANITTASTTPEFLAAVQAANASNRALTNNASRSLVTGTGATGFQVSSTRDATVAYSVSTSTTATIGGASTATVVLELCATNSATAGNWQEVGRVTNSQTITLAVALQSVQVQASVLTATIPAGWFAKLRTITAGTGSASYVSGQEELY